jgi:cytochrome c556
MNRIIFIAMLLALLAASTSESQEAESAVITSGTIMEVMVVTITPATDILWGVDDPQTDEDWQVLDDAAVTVIEAFKRTRDGGTGPNDNTWASEAKFQAYIDQEMVALKQARAAIEARDLDGLFDAGGELYMPCEDCHIDYNPAVSGKEF